MSDVKKPSGQQFRVMRREREAAAREAQRKRDEYAQTREKVVPVGAERAHLQMLELLNRQACAIENDDAINEEDRRDQLCKTAQAMGKIKAEAEVQREAELLLEESRQAKARLKEERQAWLQASKLQLDKQVSRMMEKAKTDPAYRAMLSDVRAMLATMDQ